jgi:hypothetical protein
MSTEPTFITLPDGQVVEAVPFHADYFIKGTNPDRLTLVFGWCEKGRENGWGVEDLDDKFHPAIEAALDRFWPGRRTRRGFREPATPQAAFENSVRRNFTDVGHAPDTAHQNIGDIVDALRVVALDSLVIERAKKRDFCGKEPNRAQLDPLCKALTRLGVIGADHLPVVHALMGLAGELHEVLEVWDQPEKLKLELGDVLFYLTALAQLQGLNLNQIMQANVEKLQARYPDGWSAEAAQAERTGK